MTNFDIKDLLMDTNENIKKSTFNCNKIILGIVTKASKAIKVIIKFYNWYIYHANFKIIILKLVNFNFRK